MTQTVEIVQKVKDELLDGCDTRHRLIVGGRGKGASWSIARILLLQGMQRPMFNACVREVQKTIRHSVKKLLDDTIKEFGWEYFYRSTDNEIKGNNGTLFAFFGLHDYNADNIKSLEGADACWVAEAQTISRRSINILRPTIRKDDAVMWWDFNPRYETDPIWIDYIVNKDPDATVALVNWKDNPWFNKALQSEKRADYLRNEEEARHIWEGEIRSSGDTFVCPAKLVDVAMKENHIAVPEGAIVVGADIAHQGGDEIVFYKRHGNKVIDRYTNTKMSAPETKRALKAFMVDTSVILNIDNGSLGMAIADDMEEAGYIVNRINFGGRPVDTEHYENVTTEMYFQLRDKLTFIDMPNDEELRNQLIQRKYMYINGSRGYEVMRIESKADFSEHMTGVNKSPDRADAMVLCFYDGTDYGGFGETFDDSYSIF